MSTCELLQHADQPDVCDHCGTGLTGRQKRWCSKDCEDTYWQQHYWTSAREMAKRRDNHRCVRCGSSDSLEVNHIEPRVGRGYNAGCHHHLTNLETLCHGCHVGETTRQGRERRLIKKLAAPGTLFDEVTA